MKITKSYLREVIKEELERMDEAMNVDSRTWGDVIQAYQKAGNVDAAQGVKSSMQKYGKNPNDMLFYVNGTLYHSYNDHVKQPYMQVDPKVARFL